jgi:cytochrome P450
VWYWLATGQAWARCLTRCCCPPGGVWRFPDADHLNLTRPASGHLSFGHGIHFCLGAPLARLEGEIAFNALLDRLPSIRLAIPAKDLQWHNSLVLRGPVKLPVLL